MASPLVLITGITGFLASHVLDATLAAEQNYRIRGTLRNYRKRDALLARLKSEDRARVELIEVADTATSDLSDAFQDVDYVLHTASPYQINVEDAERDLLQPALQGTLNVLRYAHKQPSVKFVGITSSFAAVTNFKLGGPNRPGYTYTSADWNPSTYEDAVEAGGAGAFSYSASKKIAEQAAWDYVEREKPEFKIATFNPPMIYGATVQPNVTRKNLNTSSTTIYSLISNEPQVPDNRLPLFCNARDVADAHVIALSQPEAANTRFLLWGGTFTWQMAITYLSQSRPELIPRLPNGWKEATKSDFAHRTIEDYAKLDVTPAKEKLGISFKGWQQTLLDSIDSLLELEKQPSWNA